MSYRSGMAIGQGLASIGFGLAGAFKRQDQEANRAEEHKWKQEDRAKDQGAEEVAAALSNDPNADLSKYDPVTRFRGMGRLADQKQKEFRVSKEGMALEREKMAMSVQRVQNLGKQYEVARSQGDDKGAEHIALTLLGHHARNGARSIEDLGNGKVLVKHLDGSKRELPKPSLKELDGMVRAYLADPKTHINQRLAEQEQIRENNARVIQDAQEWTNPQGQRIVAATGFIDPETRERKNQYLSENNEFLTEEQVKAGGFKPTRVWEDRAKVEKAKLGGDLARTQRQSLGQVDPASVFPNRAGSYTGKTIGGGYVSGDKVPETAIPAEDAKYNQVTTGEGTYGFIKKPGPGSTEQFIDTGVKAPAKEGKAEDVKLPVRNSRTGKIEEKTAKEIRANLKEAKAVLKSVKDDSGNMFVLPSVSQLEKASPEEKETVLAKIERLSTDTRQSQTVRSAAKQVLNYLEALGITQSAEQAIGGASHVGNGANADKSWKAIREDLIRLKQGDQKPVPATLQ